MNPERRMNLFSSHLQRIVAELEADGWVVTIDGRGLLGALTADFVARRGDETLIGELASRDTAERDSLEQLARLAESIPNARLQVYWLGDAIEDLPPPVNVERIIAEAQRVLPISASASLLMAWAGFEAAVSHLSSRLKLQELQTGASPWHAVTNLYSLGHVDETDFKRLSELWRVRNDIAHRGSPVSPSDEDILFVLDVARRMLAGQYVSVDDMVEWFLDRYEDPVNQLPYDGAEGGYQYQGDGPYDADDVLREAFPQCSEQALGEAAHLLNGMSTEWILKRDEQ
ncbi:hypothetical protein [Micromonospora sp. NPDC005172]|uniref:hypothetical protein n=1 Tax=Micromonospora sp. NPDC005172 TaxID=3156867 RepID=UPI0033A0EE97